MVAALACSEGCALVIISSSVPVLLLSSSMGLVSYVSLDSNHRKTDHLMLLSGSHGHCCQLSCIPAACLCTTIALMTLALFCRVNH